MAALSLRWRRQLCNFRTEFFLNANCPNSWKTVWCDYAVGSTEVSNNIQSVNILTTKASVRLNAPNGWLVLISPRLTRMNKNTNEILFKNRNFIWWYYFHCYYMFRGNYCSNCKWSASFISPCYWYQESTVFVKNHRQYYFLCDELQIILFFMSRFNKTTNPTHLWIKPHHTRIGRTIRTSSMWCNYQLYRHSTCRDANNELHICLPPPNQQNENACLCESYVSLVSSSGQPRTDMCTAGLQAGRKSRRRRIVRIATRSRTSAPGQANASHSCTKPSVCRSAIRVSSSECKRVPSKRVFGVRMEGSTYAELYAAAQCFVSIEPNNGASVSVTLDDDKLCKAISCYTHLAAGVAIIQFETETQYPPPFSTYTTYERGTRPEWMAEAPQRNNDNTMALTYDCSAAWRRRRRRWRTRQRPLHDDRRTWFRAQHLWSWSSIFGSVHR